MVVATILDIWTFPIVDCDDLHGRVIPIFAMVEGGESISELFCGYLVKVKVKPEIKCEIWQQNSLYLCLIAECDHPA